MMPWGPQGWCPSLDCPARGEGRGCSRLYPGRVLAPQPAVPSLSPRGAASRSLEAISGLESRGRVFTVHVEGLLQLQVRLEERMGGEGA